MSPHHPSEDMLMDYATGALADPLDLLVATHLSLCPDCRAESRRLEAIGGALLEEIAPTPMAPGGLDRLLARLDEPAPAPQPRPAAPIAFNGLIPEPLLSQVQGAKWRKVNAGIDEIALPCAAPGMTAQLLRIRAGASVPRHSHHGREFTLVLAGGFSDQRGRYGRGDLSVADSALTHMPVADSDQDCYCLAVVDGGLRLAGPIGRVVSLFWKF